MLELLIVVVRALTLALRGQRELVLENLALRQQLAALHRTTKRARLRTRDRLFWIALARSWRLMRGNVGTGLVLGILIIVIALGMTFVANLIPVLIKAIQEQQGTLERAQAEIKTLRAETEALSRRIISIEATSTTTVATSTKKAQ